MLKLVRQFVGLSSMKQVHVAGHVKILLMYWAVMFFSSLIPNMLDIRDISSCIHDCTVAHSCSCRILDIVWRVFAQLDKLNLSMTLSLIPKINVN